MATTAWCVSVWEEEEDRGREGDIEKGGNFGIYPTVDLRTIAWYVAGPAEVLGQGGGKAMLEEGCGAWEV